ncbi:DUF2079 domain-containing protein [Actinocrinis puniceicyclus]|uniref:DUF2079 domain-containing protein n=1 Tax=Actinocrinis puniceicyclus TaxID=977794 RepID=A0A8J7WPT8_9ACTN|nr:DUF2079 domain-containing protein [Actinocrinis puniceicyclus]MBS2963304.1 DUF2079 domain-containing protein [Actinocrinis puniceicyclus]
MSTPTAVGGESASGRPTGTGRRWPHVLGVGAIASIYATLYSAYLLGLHATLKDGLADVGEYDQAISGYAHFMGPHSPFIGLRGPGDAGVLQLSDHFTPLLVLLAPFYWIHDGPETLFIETAVLSALPIIPLWIYARRAVARFGHDGRFGRTAATVSAYLVVIGYGVTWPLQMALWFEFHEVFLELPILMWAIERAHAGRLRQAALISLLLLGVKDDMGFVVALFGLYLAAKDATLRDWARLLRRAARRPLLLLGTLRRRDRAWFLALVPIGLGMVWLVAQVLLPAFGGSPNRDFTYTEFGPTQSAALHAMLADPAHTAHTLINTPVKRQTLEMLLWPVLGLCLLSPLSLVAVPLVAERFLSVNQLYWVMPYHYNAFLVPIIFCGGVDGALRLSRWLAWSWRSAKDKPAVAALRGTARRGARSLVASRARPAVARIEARVTGRYPLAISALMMAFAAYVAGYGWNTFARYPMHHMTMASFWNTSAPSVVAAKQAAARIPDGVYVAAATQLGPQLLSRDKVVMWGPPGDRAYPAPSWIVADVQRSSYPFTNVAAQQAEVRRLESAGYRVVFQSDGWVVLHDPSPR